jgi:hypothetical protein
MRLTIIILVLTLVLFSPLSLSQDVQAQHGDGDMAFNVYVFDHDIEITQIDEHQIRVVEKITIYNPSENETYNGTILCWAQEGSVIARFGPLVNDSYQGGNYSKPLPLVNQYDLGENGYEIPANDTIQMLFEYDIEFSSDTFYYGKTFYYTNYFTVVSVNPLSDTEIATTDIHLDYNEQGQYYITHDSDVRRLGDTFSIRFRPKEETSDGSIILILAVIVIIAAVIIVQQGMSRNSDHEGKGAKTSGKTGAKKAGSKKTGSGKFDMRKKSTSEKQKKQKHDPVEKKQSKEDLDALMEKKKNLLAAIKRLDEDHDSGLLPEDIYSELKEEYKLKAVDVLKSIDGLK